MDTTLPQFFRNTKSVGGALASHETSESSGKRTSRYYTNQYDDVQTPISYKRSTSIPEHAWGESSAAQKKKRVAQALIEREERQRMGE